ncbi:MAG: subclass B3 metallo-beta-lactamase, partial [Acidobacteriia bacterium]|nr:subclass B3 metallo-beta-lactamase [Terriglobia bacterium]
MRRRTFLSMLSTSLLPGQGRPEWDEAFPPHKIADNLYYTGTKGLSTYLITTSQGNILINSSFERTVPKIKAAIEQLGFQYRDIKI